MSDDQDQLVNAVSSKNVEKLRRLLSRGVDPYFVDYEGKSPLHIVCSMPTEPSKYHIKRIFFQIKNLSGLFNEF